jgi:hypothetical protein
MTNKANDAAEVGKRLRSIVDYVRDCQARVTKGEIMDLQGLDQNVIEVCDELAHLPEKDGQALESQMTQLIESLEVLARTMKEQQDNISAMEAS